MSNVHRSLTFWERHPILQVALKETYHFSRTQLLMNAALAIIAIPVSYYYELLTGIQLWPTIKTVVVIYTALLVATAIFNFIRAPLRLLSEHHLTLAELTEQRLAQVQTRALPDKSDASVGAFVHTAEPNIEFTNPEVVTRWLNRRGGVTDEEVLKTRVLLARFYYKPDRGVPPMIYVKAHVAFANAEGVPIKARYDAIWDKGQENEYKEFQTADTHGLVIAVLSDAPEKGIATYKYNDSDGEFQPECDMLFDEEFRLRLELIGKYHNEPILNKSLEFTLSLDPQVLFKLID